jgi:hypothetical protein
MDGERPTPRPRPAPVAEDPARPSGGPPPLPPVRGRVRKGPEPLVQLNTRVPVVLDELVALVQDTRGLSKREVVELALRTAYAVEYQELLARRSLPGAR